MKPKILTYCLLAILCLICGEVEAKRISRCDSVSRPVTQIYNLEVGSAMQINTYLSPLRYKGKELALTGLWSKGMPFNPNWTMDFDARLEVGRSLSPSQTSAMLETQVNFFWGMNRRWQLPYRVMVTAGASVGIDGGILYLPHNSNNPADGNFWTGISLKAGASWPFRIGRLPILLSDRISIPTLGAFFCPEYGESYYEIYLGNREGLAHFGWWGNCFGLDNHLAVTLDFGRTAMQLGYRIRLTTNHANNLDTQLLSNAFTIGVIPHGIGLKNRKPCTKTQIINALY